MTSVTDPAYVCYLTRNSAGILFCPSHFENPGFTQHTQKRNHYNQRDNANGHLIGTVRLPDILANHRT